MCSSGGDIEDISSQIRGSLSKGLLTKCKKCSEKSVIVLQKKDPFCKSCFFEYCNHKFRSTIGKSKKIKHGDKVLLACSGGHKSAALLHMTMQTLKSASMKQISFKPAILFIDETFLEISSCNNSTTDALPVLEQFKKNNCPVFYSSLEMVYQIYSDEDLFLLLPEGNSSDTSLMKNEELRSRINRNFKDMPLSSKIDLLKHLRLLLITEIASRGYYDCVFLGDTASSLAIELLSDISLGRGSQISADTSFYDTRYKVPICRPLREFLNKEIALYNHLHSIVFYVFPDFLTKASSNSCIQRLTETFLTSLQENFPATIFTVFRTGGKLSKNNTNTESKTCIICKSELDNINPDPCSALEALEISQELSSTSTVLTEEKNSIVFLPFVCHGCTATIKNVPDPNVFKKLTLQKASARMERDAMKAEIKDYLIDNSDN